MHFIQNEASPSTTSVCCVTPTKCCVPLFQELHLDDLIDRRSIIKFVNQGGNQVLVVARENAQMISRFVAQTLAVVGMESHQDGGTTAEGTK